MSKIVDGSSLYELLMEVVDDDGTGYLGPPARALLKAIRTPPPEIAAKIDPAAWVAAIDAAMDEADRIDAIWHAEEVEGWRARWPAVLAKLTEIGAEVTRSTNPRTPETYLIALPWQPCWCVVSLRDAAIVSDDQLIEHGRGHDHSGLDTLVRVAQDHMRQAAEARAERDRLATLRRTHSWDAKTRRWRPKLGNGPSFASGITLAEYEAAVAMSGNS